MCFGFWYLPSNNKKQVKFKLIEEEKNLAKFTLQDQEFNKKKTCIKKGIKCTVIIETQTTIQINFDKYEMRGEIYSESTYVLGLPWATTIGLEHVEKNLRTMNTTTRWPPSPPTIGYDTLQIEWPKSLTLLVVVQLGWKLVKGADFSRR